MTVVVEMRVRRPVAHKFEPHLRDYADFAKLHLEATGNVPRLPLAASAAPPTTVTNIFRNDGHYWTIKFAGVEFRLKNAKGVRYIAHLLHTPQQKVHILGLIAAVDAPQGRPIPTAYTKMTQEELAAENLRASRKDGVDDMALVDPQAMRELQQRLEQLAGELEEAGRDNDPIREAEARQEFDSIIGYLDAATGWGGRARAFTTPAERARVNVTKAIKATMKEIGKYNPALQHHLATHIKTGYWCSYDSDPDHPVSWQF